MKETKNHKTYLNIENSTSMIYCIQCCKIYLLFINNLKLKNNLCNNDKYAKYAFCFAYL